MQYNYNIQKLIEDGFDFTYLFPEKQKHVKEMTGFSFNLQDIVNFLQKETNDFKTQIPLALSIDGHINEIYTKFKEGESKQDPDDDEEPIPQESDIIIEWKDAIDSLELLIKDKLGDEEQLAQWQSAVDTLNSLIETTE